MDREKMVLDYIKANPRCTKTDVKNAMPFSPPTTDKILKELINKTREVICEIDEVNPQIHHLTINGPGLSLRKVNRLILSKFEKELKNRMYMSTQLLDTGEWIIWPVDTPSTTKYYLPSLSEIVEAQLDKTTG